MSKKKTGISGRRRIDSYKDWKFYDRKNKEKYKEAWKERKGKETARGWNESPEWKAYQKSKQNRIKTLYGRNPKAVLDNAERVFRKQDVNFRAIDPYKDIEVYNSIGEIYTDLENLIVQAAMAGKGVEVSMNLQGLYESGEYFGAGNVKAALMREVSQWRAEQSKLPSDDSFVVEVSGELQSVDIDGTMYFSLDISSFVQ